MITQQCTCGGEIIHTPILFNKRIYTCQGCGSKYADVKKLWCYSGTAYGKASKCVWKNYESEQFFDRVASEGELIEIAKSGIVTKEMRAEINDKHGFPHGQRAWQDVSDGEVFILLAEYRAIKKQLSGSE